MSTGWLKELEERRKEKDDFFATQHESPIPHGERKGFRGLKYFPPDRKFTINTKLQRYEKPEIIQMATSAGTAQRFYRIGYFEFEISTDKVRVQAYQSAERKGDEIFIPFRDKTSGKDSYDSGRYLDFHSSKDDEYLIDFNFAYNPFCAYSDEYVCPFPPNENWLDVEIRAGERKYHE